MAPQRRMKSLSHGRPPVAKEKGERMSSMQTRTIIRTHHRLHKQLAAAEKNEDEEAVETITKAIEKNGGLKVYQAASKQGQSKLRGGDSSKLLVEWLQDAKVIRSKEAPPATPYRLLEVGALSTDNDISKRPRIINVTRIDLNSQGAGIEQQDFMERPLPASDEERFDIISLSLVLNYVPEPEGRGEMLKRITQFLRAQSPSPEDKTSGLPALFLVLPLPCVANSRYLDEETLVKIMFYLGFTLTRKKDTPKLCHYLFTLNGEKLFETQKKQMPFPKRKIRDSPRMNNFCIVME